MFITNEPFLHHSSSCQWRDFALASHRCRRANSAMKPGNTALHYQSRRYHKKSSSMSNFHYVYILVDEATGTHFYIGCTEDLKSRLEKHNKGDVPHTSKYKPWRIKNAIASENREKAYAFEAYLKTHCGRAFAKRHF